MSACKVLIVDDEQFVREHFERHIPWAESGFSWMGAAVHGQQALQMMERELPDIVLTDITMPVMDGISFAQKVKERWPQVEIIFLTAHDEFSYAQQAIGLGAKNYLLKMGLSKERIIEACQKAAEGMLRTKSERSEEIDLWNRKKLLIEAWLYNQSVLDEEGELETALYLHGRYYVYASIICTLHDQSRIQSERSLESLQRNMAGKLESWTGESALDVKVVAFPLGGSSLIIQLSIAQGFGMQVMQQLVHQFRQEAAKDLSQLYEVNGSIYLSSIGSHVNERRDKLFIALQKAEQSFYAAELNHPAELGRYDRIQQLEQAAKLTKLLGRREWAAFLAEVNRLTTLQTPLCSPLYLVNVARTVLDHIAHIPDRTFRHYSLKLKLITEWAQYLEWWQQLIAELSIPLQLLHEKTTVRKEIQRLCELIAADIGKDLTIRMLAEEMQMNAAYLGQLFKQETGEYLSDYMSRVRIEKAKELLQQTDLKIYEVSQKVGIDNYRYFCKMFKEHVGTTPTAFKRSTL